MLYDINKDIKVYYISFYLDFIINNKRFKSDKFYNTLRIIYKYIIN